MKNEKSDKAAELNFLCKACGIIRSESFLANADGLTHGAFHENMYRCYSCKAVFCGTVLAGELRPHHSLPSSCHAHFDLFICTLCGHPRRAEGHTANGTKYALAPRGDSQSTIWGSWCSEGSDRYIRCLSCGRWNSISRHITIGGTLSECIVCCKCNSHFYVKLEDYLKKETK